MAFAPQHILVPVALDPEDDLTMAKFAVDTACDIAEKFNAKMTLLYLASMITPGQPEIFDVTGQVLEAFTDLLKARYNFGANQLAELEEVALARGIKIEGRLIENVNKTPNVIVKSATDVGADLLVVSSHGRHGLSKVLFGSVAAKIAEFAPMPVLLLHPPAVAKAKKK